MSKIDPRWPAFPCLDCSQDQLTGATISHQSYGGMTLRDYFAAKAMQGLLSMPEEWRSYLRRDGDGTTWKAEAVKAAYELADAMLIAREAS